VQPAYLDYNATTPIDRRVFDAMRPFLVEEFGNAESRTHVYGQSAKRAVNKARDQVARLLAVRPDEIIFTSGATESNNAVLLGLAAHGRKCGRMHILATAIEHASVLAPLRRLKDDGFMVELVPVTAGGYVEPDAVKSRLRHDTLLVSTMHANNETGVRQPLSEIARLLVGSKILFHVDAAQTYGKEVDDLRSLECDFLSISAHKIFGPKGIGALYVRNGRSERAALLPILHGGGQESGSRPGTLPVALAVGLGVASELSGCEYLARRAAAEVIRQDLLDAIAGVDHHVNGDPKRIQAHVLNIFFPGIDSEALMLTLRDAIAISNGSACASDRTEPSHVLSAMGLSPDRIASSVRFSWGPGVQSIPYRAIFEAVKGLAGT
jgi:cysteine desulfurase